MPALYTTAWHQLRACSNWFKSECTYGCPCMRLTSGAHMWTVQLRDSSPLLRLGISLFARG
eukprot:10825916-Alexandrium_andersonii.AAC.1